MPYFPLDGPAVYKTLTVGTSAVEAKVDAAVLDSRKVVSIQPLDDVVYVGYDASVTTSSAAMKIFKSQYIEFERSDDITIYLISPTASNSVLISEIA